MQGDIVLDDTTDGSLLHAYENLSDCGHLFGPCIFSTGRKLQVMLKPLCKCMNTRTLHTPIPCHIISWIPFIMTSLSWALILPIADPGIRIWFQN